MTQNENGTLCGLPHWLQIPSNDTASFINDVVLSAVNVPFCAFAFIGNMAVIVAVIKTPSLQSPCNVLLCSLATTDCLTGLIAQPIFVAWRLMIHRIHESCDHQVELFNAYNVCQAAFAGWSFANITLISFDRHYALAKPLVYRTSITKKEAVQAAVIAGIIWLLLTVLIRVTLPTNPAFYLSQVLGLSFVILPILNHIGIFIAIRRHNNQVVDAVSGQNLSVLFKREKKATIDMLIVIVVLMLFLAPSIFINMFQRLLSDKFEVLYVWSSATIFLNSSINPVIYLVRNREIRSAVRSIMCF
ncbi:trace amine-associated receptor 4-like [Oculina patagonica]